jgi:hypothetical protein
VQQKKLVKYNSFYQDPVVRNGLLFALVLWLSSSLSLVWYYQFLPPVVPMFYSLVRGSTQLADKPFVAVLPIMSFTFLITHAIFAWVNYSQDMVFSRVMTLSASLGVFICSVAVWHMLWIVL